MKRVRCPKCDNYIRFDENRYEPGRKLVFQCPQCGREFAIRIKSTAETSSPESGGDDVVGHIVVIENVFHVKQELPLHMGDNVIGRYHKTGKITTPIETNDPSMDFTHCVINVSRDKDGCLKYILRDGPSNTGTWIDNEILGDRERRVVSDGTIFTIGATSIIIKGGCRPLPSPRFARLLRSKQRTLEVLRPHKGGSKKSPFKGDLEGLKLLNS